jgi:hypothetical protein
MAEWDNAPSGQMATQCPHWMQKAAASFVGLGIGSCFVNSMIPMGQPSAHIPSCLHFDASTKNIVMVFLMQEKPFYDPERTGWPSPETIWCIVASSDGVLADNAYASAQPEQALVDPEDPAEQSKYLFFVLRPFYHDSRIIHDECEIEPKIDLPDVLKIPVERFPSIIERKDHLPRLKIQRHRVRKASPVKQE